MILNIKASFVYGWFSLRGIDVHTDNEFCASISGTGNYSIQIPESTKIITFTMGRIKQFKTTVTLTPADYEKKDVYVGLYLNHRGILLALYDSLKPDYLRSRILSPDAFLQFDNLIHKEQEISLKDAKASLLAVLISTLILVFSVVQQSNDLSPFAFFIGLSSLITSLVYYNQKKVLKSRYKVRMISTVVLFIIAVGFLENSYAFLHWVILLFTALLLLFSFENLRNNENTKIKEA